MWTTRFILFTDGDCYYKQICKYWEKHTTTKWSQNYVGAVTYYLKMSHKKVEVNFLQSM